MLKTVAKTIEYTVDVENAMCVLVVFRVITLVSIDVTGTVVFCVTTVVRTVVTGTVVTSVKTLVCICVDVTGTVVVCLAVIVATVAVTFRVTVSVVDNRTGRGRKVYAVTVNDVVP